MPATKRRAKGGRQSRPMAAFVNARRGAPAAPRRREAVGAAFARAFAAWTAPTTLARPNGRRRRRSPRYSAIYPLELTASASWRWGCDGNTYAIRSANTRTRSRKGNISRRRSKYPVFEPVRLRPEYGRVRTCRSSIRPRLLRHHPLDRSGGRRRRGRTDDKTCTLGLFDALSFAFRRFFVSGAASRDVGRAAPSRPRARRRVAARIGSSCLPETLGLMSPKPRRGPRQ